MKPKLIQKTPFLPTLLANFRYFTISTYVSNGNLPKFGLSPPQKIIGFLDHCVFDASMEKCWRASLTKAFPEVQVWALSGEMWWHFNLFLRNKVEKVANKFRFHVKHFKNFSESSKLSDIYCIFIEMVPRSLKLCFIIWKNPEL